MSKCVIDETVKVLKAEGKLPSIEIHKIVPMGVSCSNRNFNGRSKTVRMGGGVRTVISSQAQRFPWRRELYKKYDNGATRSRYILQKIAYVLTSQYGRDDAYAFAAMDYLKTEEGQQKNGTEGTKQILAFCDNDINDIAKIVNESFSSVEDFKDKDKKQSADDLLKQSANARALDPTTALLGPMSTEKRLTRTVYSAVKTAFAYSVDEWAGDYDTFTAVEEQADLVDRPEYEQYFLKHVTKKDGSEEVKKVSSMGAGMLGDRDIGSNTYYCYMNINMETLFRNLLSHLKSPSEEEIKWALELSADVVSEYVKYDILIPPVANQSSMASSPVPAAVYVTMGTDIFPLTVEDYSANVIRARDNESVTEIAVDKLARFANDKVTGAFACNDYQTRLWLSDLYADKCPEGVEISSMKGLKAKIFEALTGGEG